MTELEIDSWYYRFWDDYLQQTILDRDISANL